MKHASTRKRSERKGSDSQGEGGGERAVPLQPGGQVVREQTCSFQGKM